MLFPILEESVFIVTKVILSDLLLRHTVLGNKLAIERSVVVDIILQVMRLSTSAVVTVRPTSVIGTTITRIDIHYS
jgi:hypothetical protein